MGAATRSQRLVSGINGSIAIGLVAVLAAVALVVKPPAPPGIAEFAPQATKPISKAPLGQSAGLTNGGRVGPDGKPLPSPTPLVAASALATPSVRGVPSSLQCYQWPDGSVTQTFDPQSPPCVAAWPDAQKGNGGATTRGVTGREIRIAEEDCSDHSVPGPTSADLLTRFFNSHFELYGRQLRLLPFPCGDGSPSGQRAQAAQANAFAPFAATGLLSIHMSLFADALAGRQVIVTFRHIGYQTLAHLVSRAPFEWSYEPTLDVVEKNLAAFICRSLPATHTAQWAGGELNALPRKFAILYPNPYAGRESPEYADLQHGLAACGVDAPAVQYWTEGASASVNSTNAQLMTDLRSRQVTTLIAFGDPYELTLANGSNPMPAASAVNYQPEWILPGTTSDYPESQYGAGGPADQTQHMLGLASWNKHLPLGTEPPFQAQASEQPGQTPGRNDIDSHLYRQLLLLASGIQAAGPHLTPATFAQALRQLSFPNPGAGGPPAYQATVGFAQDEPFMVRDFAAWSYNNAVTSNESGMRGATCDVYRGRRWSLAAGWPQGPLPLFDPAQPCY